MSKKGFVIGGIVLAAACAGGWYYYQNYYSVQSVLDEDVVYVTKVSDLTESDISGVQNRFAGVVEAQETVKVNIASGRKVNEVQVSEGDTVSAGQLLFEYDLTSIEEDLQEAQLDYDKLVNEQASLEQTIATLEKEKKKASSDSQLDYTIEIEENKLSLQKNAYSQESKLSEIEQLQSATTDTKVYSEIDGIIQKIDTSKLSTDDGDSLTESDDYYSDSDSSSDSFITILSTGAYRVKGKVNEQNVSSIVAGEAVIIRSRVDETQTWTGIMGGIDENSSDSSDDDSYYSYAYGDSSSSSTSYTFYVELDSSDELMLGQHVYIEKDVGQEDQKSGLWLEEYYIVDAETDSPYVWAVDENGKLEKRSVTLGDYDEEMMQYEVTDGLTTDDSIAFPEDDLTEGLPTADVSLMPEEIEEDTEDTSDDEWNLEETEIITDGDWIVESTEEWIEESTDEEWIEEDIETDTEEDYEDVTADLDEEDLSIIDDGYEDVEVISDMDVDDGVEVQTYGSEDTEAAG